MSALGDYSRGNLGREWGRPHSLRRRLVNQVITSATIIGSWLIVMAVAGASFFIVTSPFLGTVLRFLEPPITTAAAPAAPPVTPARP